MHVGVPDLGITEQIEGQPPQFTAYSYDAVRTVFGDPTTFSSAGYSAIMGAVLGRTILEMDPPEHGAYRSILQQAFTKVAMQRWETELVEPLVHRMIDVFADADCVPRRGHYPVRGTEGYIAGETRTMSMVEAILSAQSIAMEKNNEVFILGEDVGDPQGGV